MGTAMSGDTLWQEITGMPQLSDQTRAALAKLDPLKRAWEEAARRDPATFMEARERTLRSHAIETGIIERLYDVSWGVTATLVAEGLRPDVAERAGASAQEREALPLIRDQYAAVEYVAALAHDDD